MISNIFEASAVKTQLGGKRALVLGGGIGGLISAYVLVDFFEQIIILEKDNLDLSSGLRNVSRGQDTHIIGRDGYPVLLSLFPDLESRLARRGIVVFNAFKKGRYFEHGKWSPAIEIDSAKAFILSRVSLEQLLIEALSEKPNVTFIQECPVSRIFFKEKKDAYVVQHLQKEVSPLAADFIVDTMGRNSLLPVFMQENGYESPELSSVRIDMDHASATFQMPPNTFNPDWAVFVINDAENAAAAAFLTTPSEVRVAFYEYRKERPPELSLQGIQRHAEILPDPSILTIIRSGNLVKGSLKRSPVRNITKYDYSALGALPNKIVALGDSVCATNPKFGRGVTSCAMQASVLKAMLSAGIDNFSPSRYYAQVMQITQQFFMQTQFPFEGKSASYEGALAPNF